MALSGFEYEYHGSLCVSRWGMNMVGVLIWLVYEYVDHSSSGYSALCMNMWITVRRVSLVCLAVYLLMSCYTAYVMFMKLFWSPKHKENKKYVIKDWNSWGFEFENKPKKELLERPHDTWLSSFSENNIKPGPGDHVVEIWAKAAVGLYLWEHIFQGKLKALPNNGITSEALRSGNIIFRFCTGPGLHPHTVSVSSRHI